MSNSLEKIQKLLKSADMPLLPGSKRVNKRNLNWIRFDRNVLLQNLSKLPDPVKAALSKKLDEFYQEFQKLPRRITILKSKPVFLWFQRKKYCLSTSRSSASHPIKTC
jgi:hypothetical protein